MNRKKLDANNNSEYSNLVKLKYKKKKVDQISMYNIVDNISLDRINKEEFAFELFKDVTNCLALQYIEEIKEMEISSSQQDIMNIISYSLGTYFSEKYVDDPKVCKKMLRLISDQCYTFQELIEDIGDEEQRKSSKNQLIVI